MGDFLRNIDFLFIMVIVFLISVTPLRTKYSHMMWLIGAIFLANIGVAEVGIALVNKFPEVSQAVSSASIVLNITISTIFAFLFWPKQINHSISSNINQYLSVLCVLMTVFYFVDMVRELEEQTYVATMISFQVLMLVMAFWGVIDGNSYRVNSWARSFYYRIYHRFHHNGKR